MAEETDLPYQLAPQVEQLRQERANAEAYGQDDRVAAVDKQLEALGVKLAAAKRKAAAEGSGDEDEAKKTPPPGRSAKPQQKT